MTRTREARVFDTAIGLADGLAGVLNLAAVPTVDGRVIVYAPTPSLEQVTQQVEDHMRARLIRRVIRRIPHSDARFTILEISTETEARYGSGLL